MQPYSPRDLVRMLDGKDYPLHLSPELRSWLVGRGLVIAQGLSDDMLRLSGAIELESYDMDLPIGPEGVRKRCCADAGCPHADRDLATGPVLRGVFTPEGSGPAWRIEANFPHERFRVMEDGEVFCEAIAFSLQDVKLNPADIFTQWEPTEAEVASACMSYRHDFGLLDPEAKKQVIATARHWLIAWKKEFAWAYDEGRAR